MSRWSAGRRWGLVAWSLLLLVVAAVVAIYAGLYNIAADVPHTQPVYWLFDTVRERSVAARARDIVVPNDLGDANRISKGAGEYAEMCSGCYLAPGMKRTDAVSNPCYFAMDATRPGGLGRRFYVICEADRTFRAVPSGHGYGRNLEGIANFANGIRCAKNFSNAMDSNLTTGGPYVTAEIRTSFKGYYRASGGELVPLIRSELSFDKPPT